MQGNLLEYSLQGNKKIFSWSTLELVINKLETLVIFRNSLEGDTCLNIVPPLAYK